MGALLAAREPGGRVTLFMGWLEAAAGTTQADSRLPLVANSWLAKANGRW